MSQRKFMGTADHPESTKYVIVQTKNPLISQQTPLSLLSLLILNVLILRFVWTKGTGVSVNVKFRWFKGLKD